MPRPSPFHSRTQPLCRSYQWKDWAGFYAVCRYLYSHEAEYFALRHACGLIDVSPLYKYDITGPDAAKFLSWFSVRDLSRLGSGRVAYTCWCDDDGKVIDDGTVARLQEDTFRLTSALPAFHWLLQTAGAYRVSIEDRSEQRAALAIQGPTSRETLNSCVEADLDQLGFFGIVEARLAGARVWVSRTGYTGDLGFEIWLDREDAETVWDAVMEAGRSCGLLPAGLDALDMTRVEAAFLLQGVDYFGAHSVVHESYKSSPFELSLDWLVNLERGPFIGRGALEAERKAGPPRRFVGIELDWDELQKLYDEHGLPPSLPPGNSRNSIPVFASGTQIGRVSSHLWSPLLKKALGIGTIQARYGTPGTGLEVEHTIEFERKAVAARVVDTPFFDPPRKRA